MHPAFAWGDYLDEWALTVGIERKPSVKATGEILVLGDVGIAIAAGTRVGIILSDPDADPVEFTTVTSTTLAIYPGVTGLTAGAEEDVGALPPATYYYRVSALTAAGETVASLEASAVIASAPNGQITLDWDDLAGATGYRIYRSTAPNEERFLEEIGATSTYLDNGDVTPSGARHPTNTLPVEAVEPGASGNVPPGAITQLLTPIQGVSVTNPMPTSGGADVESDELLRKRVLLEFSSRPGAGTVADYERWALGYAPVGYATVEPLWSGAGTVRVIVTDQDNNPVAPSVVTGLQQWLDPVPGEGRGQAPIGAIVTVITPTTVLVDVAASLVLWTGYSLDGAAATIAVRADIEAAVTDYIDRLKPGEDVVLHNVRSQIFKVPGVYDVPSVTLEGAATNLAIAATQIALTQTPISLS